MNSQTKFLNRKSIIIWSVFFIINAVVAVQLKDIAVIPDELNPLGIPAYLSGMDWSTAISNYKNYYGYGQAILYTPLFLLIKDGVLLYKAIILFNSFLVSIIPMIAYKILREFFQLKDDNKTFIIACVVGAQPCYLTLSKRAWNESLVMLLLWIVCYLILKCFKTKDNKKINIISSILLAITLMYGYATHGRFIAIIGAVIIVSMGYILIFKKKIVSIIPFTITILIMFICDKIIKNILLQKIWLVSSESELRNTFSETLHRLLENILSMDTLYVYLRAFSGYLFYLFIASLGMIILGTILYCKIIKRSFKKNTNYSINDNEAPIFFGAFCICLIICGICVAIMFFTTDLLFSKDYFYIYGRYTEYLIGPMLMLTLVIISKYKPTVNDLILSSIIFIVQCGYTFLLEAKDITDPDKILTCLNVFTLESFSYNYDIHQSKLAFFLAIIVAIIFFLIIILLLYKNKKMLSYIFILFIFMISYVHTAKSVLIPNSVGVYKSVETSYNFFDNISLDEDYKKIYLYNLFPHTYQMLLNEYDFQPIYGRQDVIDKNTFIITTGVYNINCDYRDLYEIEISNSKNNGERILVYGNELAEKLSQQGIDLKSFTYDLGKTIEFSNSNLIDTYKKSGWSDQEDWGMWSEGIESELYFMLNDEPKKDLVIDINAKAFNSDKNIDVFINNTYLTNINVSTEISEYKVYVPHNLIENTKDLNLTFKINDTLISPQELGMNEDARKLGFGISSVKIY